MTDTILKLATIKASALNLPKRAAPPQSKVLKPTFWDRYDTDTLIYDCVLMPQLQRVRLFLPKLLNFQTPMTTASYRIDGISRRTKLRRFQRFDIIDITVDSAPRRLEITTGGASVTIDINADETARYAGSNAIYTMVKDGSLDWVRDWVKAHQVSHGADAVLIANNNSTAFTSQMLLRAIQDVPGIKVANVIDAPLRYAPAVGTATQLGAASFLQSACLNIMRDRFFARARAVLACDVDELVNHPAGQSIFDATVASPFKYKTFHGMWRFASQTDEAVRHVDHVLSDRDNAICASKYCIVPDSILGRMCWSVHSLENINRRIFRPRNKFRFFHCRGINTSWKHNRAGSSDTAGPPDAETQAFMSKTFG